MRFSESAYLGRLAVEKMYRSKTDPKTRVKYAQDLFVESLLSDEIDYFRVQKAINLLLRRKSELREVSNAKEFKVLAEFNSFF